MEVPVLESVAPQKGQEEDQEKVNILLVDDNLSKLFAHETILSELGETVITARSGEEALSWLLQKSFAVILLDVKMPGLDGFETAALIRQHPRFENVPIIFVSGYNTSDLDRLKGYELGAVDYMFLPVVPDVLIAKVQAFVKLARQTRTIQRQAEDMAEKNRELAARFETIQELNTKLRETNEELESYTYTVSHDLRAPLRHMTSFCEVLLDECGPRLDERARKLIKGVREASATMDRLTTDLLEYTRIGRKEIQLQPIRLHQLLAEIIGLCPALQPPQAQIGVDSELLPVLGNPTLLTQCLSNLLRNAVKFVPSGVTPKIHVWTQRVPGGVRIWVEDNGIGIAPAHHRKIFSLFERVGNVKQYEGTGVGLAIFARAVRRMNGTYGVESALGAGSRFWLELEPADEAEVLPGVA